LPAAVRFNSISQPFGIAQVVLSGVAIADGAIKVE
jgi:hypothetical protein